MLQAGVNARGSAALHWAAAARSISLTRLLLAAGAGVDHVVRGIEGLDKHECTALCVAAEWDAVDIAEVLCEYNSLSMARFLVGRGAELDVGLEGCGPHDNRLDWALT
jgi:ankyrin repeat protein